MEALRKNARLQTKDKGDVRKVTRKVKNALGNSRQEREKAVQEWSNDMQQVIQPEERKREARERMRMEREDSSSQRRQAWENIWDPRVLALSTFLVARN